MLRDVGVSDGAPTSLAERGETEQQESDSEQQQQAEQEKSNAEQQPAQQAAAEQADKNESSQPERNANAEQQADEKRESQQALEQWLRRIPDDPEGLLRRKFLYQYRQRRENS